MLFILHCTRASEIKSMSPSLVHYNWFIVRTLRRNITHSTFEIHQSFKRFGANIALVDQEWLKLGVVLFCRRKESIQQLLLTSVSASLTDWISAKEHIIKLPET